MIQKVGALIFDQKWNWNVTWSATWRASGNESGVGENLLYDSATLDLRPSLQLYDLQA